MLTDRQKKWSWAGGITIGITMAWVMAANVMAQMIPGQEMDAATLAAQQYRSERLAAIDADREGVVQKLAARWAQSSGESVEGLAQTILLGASGEDLLAMQDATNYDQVRGILLGQSGDTGGSLVLGGPAGASAEALALGNPDQDLVFTPVTPCRIVDTRFTAQGAIPANGTRSFHVHGIAATIGGQGGNPAGCPAPGGEPRAVHINVTVVPVGGKGFVKVYPAGTPEPNASLVNFKLGTNIANAATVKTCFVCGPDITVKVSKAAHVIIDVLGYYYTPQQLVVEQRTFADKTINSTTITNVGSISITVPGPGTIVVRASGYIVSLGEDSVTQFGIGSSATTIIRGVWGGLDGGGIGSSDLYTPCYDEQHFPNAATGTLTYYLNARLWSLAQTNNSNVRLPVLSAQYIPE